MRLVHWINPPPKGAISGMKSTTFELVEAEIGILGVRNVSLCESANEKGGTRIQMRRRALVTQPWEDQLNDPDAVHIIHTYPPKAMYDMKRKVLAAQGVPEYCWLEDLVSGVSTWWQICALTRLCDATVSWFKRDTEFWSELGSDKVYAVRRGIDLKHWTPIGETHPYAMHPHILYAETMRLVKQPFSLLFAVKKVQRRLKQAHLRIVLSDPKQHIAWSNLITKLNIDHICPVIFGLLKDPRPMFRGSDIGVSPTMWGLVSRVPVELMASGKPVICLRGYDDSPIYGSRVEDSPEAIAAAIFKLWDKIQSDPEGEKLRARRLAEKYWDVRDTAKGIIKVCESVM